MRIGLLCNFYGFPEYTARVLAPWKNIPEVKQVAVSSCKYPEYALAGWDKEDVRTPIQLLTEHRDFIDFLSIAKEGDDSFSRNPPLAYLVGQDVDFVWLLDQDEFYTEQDITNVIEYIATADPVCTYKINFRNFVFSENQYIEGFNPPRIFRVFVNDTKALSHFYYENDVAYRINGKTMDYKQLPMAEVHPSRCAVDHHSWIGSPDFLRAKIKYQLKRYNGMCSYAWDEENNTLKFNEDYYTATNQEVPQVHKV